MSEAMILRIWDVEHGACAMLAPIINNTLGRLAMIDSGNTANWRPSNHIRNYLGRNRLDYLFITNADQDHISDLEGFWENEISVSTLIRNPYPSAEELRQIKLQSGSLTDDIKRYLNIHKDYTAPVSEPFDNHMGGIRSRVFYNSYPDFVDTNNLSLVVFVEYNGFKICFPGDIEKNGWLALLKNEQFREELKGLTILVASHHGRTNGYCDELLNYCSPKAVVFSDKSIQHDTQLTAGIYGKHVSKNHSNGVMVTNANNPRYVLTTRYDGYIEFVVAPNGSFDIRTERSSLMAA